MKRFRVIPCLLIQRNGLVKSVRFKDHKYVGDPINAVKIFNEKEVDEILLLDISATADRREPDFVKLQEIVSEAFMPLAYGGGITKIEEIQKLIQCGIEKVVLGSSAFNNPGLITKAAKILGSQSVAVCVDVKKNLFGKYGVYVENGAKNTKSTVLEYTKKMVDFGAGEIILQSVDRDGSFEGYDLSLIEKISKEVAIPLVAVGGAKSVEDFQQAIVHGASAVAAGSMFVFQRPHRAVLISYPTQQELKEKVFTQIL